MPLAWKPWLLLLLAANMIVPLLFITRTEAQVVFGTALAGGALFSLLTALAGFTRLICLAHIVWVPLVVYLALRLPEFPPHDAYGVWIRAVIALNLGSLVLDTINVVRYLRGDRAEMVEGLDRRVFKT